MLNNRTNPAGEPDEQGCSNPPAPFPFYFMLFSPGTGKQKLRNSIFLIHKSPKSKQSKQQHQYSGSLTETEMSELTDPCLHIN